MTATMSPPVQINGAGLGDNDGFWGTAMPGASWGPHRAAVTRHADNVWPTVRAVYPCIPAIANTEGGVGVSYGWKVMKRAAGEANQNNGATGWSIEAAGPNQDDVFLLREPFTDMAILIAHPASVPKISTSRDAFATSVTIPGTWQLSPNSTTRKYSSAAISPIDGTIVYKNILYATNDGSYTGDMYMDYICGAWDALNNVFVWGPQVRKQVGERFAYDHLFPRPLADMPGIRMIGKRDIFRTESIYGPFETTNYVFDGDFYIETGYADADRWYQDLTALQDPQAESRVTATGNFFSNHAHVTKEGNLMLMQFLAADGTSGFTYMKRGFYLTVYDKKGRKVQDRLFCKNMVTFGDGKFLEDGYGRLKFLLMAHGPTSPTVVLYTILKVGNQWVPQASPANLSSALGNFAPLSYAFRVASPNGGNLRPQGLVTGESTDKQTKFDLLITARNSLYDGSNYTTSFGTGLDASNNARMLHAQLYF